MSGCMGKKRKLQGDGKELRISIGFAKVNARLSSGIELETLTHHTKKFHHPGIPLSVGFKTRNDLFSQTGEAKGRRRGHDCEEKGGGTPLRARRNRDEFSSIQARMVQE